MRARGAGEIALLRSLPLFSPLGAPALEGLARGLAELQARTAARLYALDKPSFLASVSSHPRAAGEAHRLLRERLPSKQATIAP